MLIDKPSRNIWDQLSEVCPPPLCGVYHSVYQLHSSSQRLVSECGLDSVHLLWASTCGGSVWAKICVAGVESVRYALHTPIRIFPWTFSSRGLFLIPPTLRSRRIFPGKIDASSFLLDDWGPSTLEINLSRITTRKFRHYNVPLDRVKSVLHQ